MLNGGSHSTDRIDFYLLESLQLVREVGFHKVSVYEDGEYEDLSIV